MFEHFLVGQQAVTETTAIGFYLVYATIAVGLVVFLARTLHRYGKVFLREAFEPDLADAVNQLLVIGFYLLNLGYALLVFQVHEGQQSLIAAFNELVVRLGLLLLSLGVIHLVNMGIFWRIRAGRQRPSRKVPAMRHDPMLPPAPAGRPMMPTGEAASGQGPATAATTLVAERAERQADPDWTAGG